MSSKLAGNIRLDYRHAVHLLLPLLLLLHHLVLAEMLNILGMCQVFKGCIGAVELFKVMDFVFILVIAVMTRTETWFKLGWQTTDWFHAKHTEVWQLDTHSVSFNEFGKRNSAAVVVIVELNHCSYSLVFVLLRDVVRRFVFESCN